MTYYNQLSGEIPPELGNLSELTELHLVGNQLAGCVPSSLSDQLNMGIRTWVVSGSVHDA